MPIFNAINVYLFFYVFNIMQAIKYYLIYKKYKFYINYNYL